MLRVTLPMLVAATILIASCEDDTTAPTGDSAADSTGPTSDLASDLASDLGSDLASVDALAPGDDLASPDAPRDSDPVDLPAKDHTVDTQPASKCSNFAAFNCSTTDPFMLCHGSCDEGSTNYTIYCHEDSHACYCISGGRTETCPLVGSLCNACDNAFATCCSF